MMKKFLLVVCGSFVGVFLALMVFVISSVIFSLALVATGKSMPTTETVSKNSVLRITLKGDIIDREGAQDISMVDIMRGSLPEESQSLTTLLAAITEAADNKDIRGIYLDCEGSAAAPATRQVLRRALAEFKQKSDKFIYAYGYEGFSQGDYYIATVADSIFLNPVGSVDVHGLGGATPYFKSLLDKVGVEMQVIRVGTFKSAVEPYILTDMSEANRLQTEHYLGVIWNNMVDTIAAARNLTAERINQLADSVLLAMPADSLVANHVVDALRYKHDMENAMKQLLDVDKDDDINWVSPSTLATGVEESVSGKHVAVLYALGEIDGGSSTGIDTEKLSKLVYELADDDDVAALVMRVNSPGGSAFGSEQLWKALDDFKATKKPFVVSMGDYAASGGYYISAGADYIFAEPTTITGSIGIFGMIPCAEELVENKLGVHMACVKTNENADMGMITKRLTPSQRAAFQRIVNDGYELFTLRCAQGRHISQDSIKVIAEGRVWDGTTALQIGLVDSMGDLRDAVNYAAKKAGIKADDLKTQNYPEITSNWRSLLVNAINMQSRQELRSRMGMFYDYYEMLQNVGNRHHVLCLMEPMEYYW